MGAIQVEIVYELRHQLLTRAAVQTNFNLARLPLTLDAARRRLWGGEGVIHPRRADKTPQLRLSGHPQGFTCIRRWRMIQSLHPSVHEFQRPVMLKCATFQSFGLRDRRFWGAKGVITLGDQMKYYKIGYNIGNKGKKE